MREVGGGYQLRLPALRAAFRPGQRDDDSTALEIRWPNGLVQRVDDLPVNHTIRVTEGEPGWVGVYRQP